jgi:hypothetical protein
MFRGDNSGISTNPHYPSIFLARLKTLHYGRVFLFFCEYVRVFFRKSIYRDWRVLGEHQISAYLASIGEKNTEKINKALYRNHLLMGTAISASTSSK